MSDFVTTPFLHLVKPNVGAARNEWGGLLNYNVDALEAFGNFVNAFLTNYGDRLTALETGTAGAGGTEAIGTVKWWASAGILPTGYLKCDGTLYAATTYPDLFAVLGNAWGGDGVTTFSVPDLRGRVLGCVDAGAGRLAGLITDAVGQAGGLAQAAISVGEMPAHSHSATTSTDGVHTHGITVDTGATAGGTVFNIAAYQGNTALATNNTGSAGGHNHTVSTDTQGASNPHSNLQPTALGWYIIRAALGAL
jgi:microcystin-dependent protein